MSEEPRLRNDALAAYKAALEMIDPRRLVAERVRCSGETLLILNEKIDLSTVNRVLVVAIGKAAVGMAAGLEATLGDNIESGIVLSNNFREELPPKYRTFECAHPLPSSQNVEASGEVLKLADSAVEGDLVVCLISGGGSAIFTRPAEGLTLEDKRETVRLLLHAGVPINELNTVRKHLSAVKGGQFLRAIAPAMVAGLYISDVPGDNVGTIASGPTVPDTSTYADAWNAVKRFGVEKELSSVVVSHLRYGMEGLIPETPKPGDGDYNLFCNVVIGANRDMLAGLEAELRGRGYWTMTEMDPFEGEARGRGRAVANRVKDLVGSLPPSGRPYALISGGETTVRVRGKGIGGRSTELTLAAAIELKGTRDCVVLAAGTDGIDGFTDAAGAIADGLTVERAQALGIDPQRSLDENDSYSFFKPLGDLIFTGPTGTNVMDTTLALIGKVPQESERV